MSSLRRGFNMIQHHNTMMNLMVLQRDSMHHPNHGACHVTGYKYSDKLHSKIGQKSLQQRYIDYLILQKQRTRGIPNEALYRTKPKISHLQRLGKDCFIYIPEEHRLSGIKLLLRAQNGIFYGYTNSHSIHKKQIPMQKAHHDCQCLMSNSPDSLKTSEAKTIH